MSRRAGLLLVFCSACCDNAGSAGSVYSNPRTGDSLELFDGFAVLTKTDGSEVILPTKDDILEYPRIEVCGTSPRRPAEQALRRWAEMPRDNSVVLTLNTRQRVTLAEPLEVEARLLDDLGEETQLQVELTNTATSARVQVNVPPELQTSDTAAIQVTVSADLLQRGTNPLSETRSFTFESNCFDGICSIGPASPRPDCI